MNAGSTYVAACVAAFALVAPPALAADAGAAPEVGAAAQATDEEEILEEILEETDFEDVTANVAATETQQLTIPQILGRLHPMAVHLPIGWIILLLLWEVFISVMHRRFSALAPVGLLLGPAAVLSTLPAIATGLMRAEEIAAKGAGVSNVHDHRNLMLAAAVALVAAVGLRLVRRERLAGTARLVYFALLATSAALLSAGGHLGGKLVFGNAYLPF